MELRVCDVTREPLGVFCVDDKEDEDPEFRLATRWAVLGGNAEIFMGGSATGSTFLG